MQKILRMGATLMLTGAVLAGIGCGGSANNPPYQRSSSGDVSTPSGATTSSAPAPVPEHHSTLAGAAVGAVVGHELGHHALAGAAVGAAIQHHRNKKTKY